jgi:hypothetical protein
MKAEAIPTEVAQAVGEIQMFLDARQTVEQDGRRARRISRRFVKPTQQPAAF